jgi:CRISPR-associated protein Cas2
VTVVVLTAVPPGLRGHLTRWLLEISPGVFIGYVPARVRDHIWTRIIEHVTDGRALMVHSARNEQRLAFKVHNHDWTPVDHDGLVLMRRNTVPDYIPTRPKSPSTTTRTPSVGLDPDTVWRRRATRRRFKPK